MNITRQMNAAAEALDAFAAILVDVAGIVRRQKHRLDIERIRFWGSQFAELKEDPDLLRPLEDALKALGPPR
jgi:hypothetical protein